MVEPAEDAQSSEDSSQPPSDTGSEPDIDLVREAMHTTGTIGDGDEMIVVVLSLHPDGTPYDEAAQRVTATTHALYPTS